MPLLRKPKFDLVIVAVRYQSPGQIDWVRAFERRGPTWSDRRMIARANLIERIRSGERVVTGERVPLEGGTFKTFDAVRVEERSGGPALVSGSVNGQGDALANVPIL